MTTVAFTNDIHVRTTAYGTNGSFCSKEYDTKIYNIRRNQLELISGTGNEKQVDTILPMCNVLAVTSLKNCFVWWCTDRKNQNPSQEKRKYLIVDVPSHSDIKSDSMVSREFGVIDQYMAIEVVVDTITDFRYIVYKKSDFITVCYNNDSGTPMVSLHHRKLGKGITIPAKRVIDVSDAKKVHDGDIKDYITDFEPKLDLV